MPWTEGGTPLPPLSAEIFGDDNTVRTYVEDCHAEDTEEILQAVNAVLPKVSEFLNRASLPDSLTVSAHAAVSVLHLLRYHIEQQKSGSEAPAIVMHTSNVSECFSPSSSRHRSPSMRARISTGFSDSEYELFSRTTTLNKAAVTKASEIDQPDFGTCREMKKVKFNEAAPVTNDDSWRCCIHPEHMFRLCWDLASMSLILILLVAIPFELCFMWDGNSDLVLNIINITADIFFGVDIVLNCFTGFHKSKGTASHLVTDPREIVKNYARGWLWIDIVATFPFSYVASVAGGAGNETASNATSILRAVKVAKVARMLKVLRVLKLGGLTQLLEEQLVSAQSMTVAFQLSKLTVIMLLISHCTACLWFAVGYFGEQGGFDITWLSAHNLLDSPTVCQYVASLYFAITTGTTVGYGDISATNVLEQVAGSFLLVLVVVYVGHFIARVGQVVSTLKQEDAEMMKTKRNAMLFMQKRGVPKNLYHKVLRYIEHIYETESLTSLDTCVLEKLSESLQMQLALTVTGKLLKKLPLFADADDVFLTSICRVCTTRRACVGDTVIVEDQLAEEMYLLVRGEVLVCQGGETLGILRHDDWFGERSLFLDGWVYNITARCRTDCEFLVLRRQDFKDQLSTFPRVKREYDILTDEMFHKVASYATDDLCSC